MCTSDDCEDALDRREFLAGAAGALIGAAVINVPGQTYPHQYKPVTRVLDETRITHSSVMFRHGGQETIDGFLARPRAAGKYPAVLVIAGNLITEEYIPNTCAALALAGFIGLAPNIFHGMPEGQHELPKNAGRRWLPILIRTRWPTSVRGLTFCAHNPL